MSSWLAGLVVAGLLGQPPADDAVLAAAEAKAASGDLDGALREYRALVDTGRGPRALVLYRLADLERRAGDLRAAASHASEAARLFAGGRDARRASDAWNMAGVADADLGDFPSAIEHLQTAMALSREAGDWRRHAEQVGNLGTVYFPLGRYDEAARAFEASRSLADAHRGEAWAGERRTIAVANQAALLQRLGRYTEALALYQAMVDGTAPLDASYRAQILVNQGALFRRLGDPYKALDAYAAARQAFAAARDAAGEAAVLTNRGIALALDLARPDDAVGAFADALTVATAAGNPREALLAQLYRGEARLRAGRPEEARIDFAAAESLATALDAREEMWKARYGIGRVDLAAGRREAARDDFDRAIAVVEGLREQLGVPSTRADFFQDKREVYDARIAAGLGADPPGTTFALIEQSRARGWRDRLALPPVALDDLRARLPGGTVLLAYWTSAVGSALVRVTGAGAAIVGLSVNPDDLRAIDQAMRRPGDDDWKAPAARLARALLPDGVLDGAARVVIVPDGPLGTVPWDALVVDGEPLVTRVPVSLVPAAAALFSASPAGRGIRWPWTPTLAAFGDPLPENADPARRDAVRLAASAREVQAIDAVVGGAHRTFLGAENRKSALVDVLADPPPLLHLATHAVADLGLGERSRLLFSPSAAGAAADALYLREVYALRLTGVDLAVLSACETERGPEVRGEGVQGFSRALLAAGARRAVTTLWRVPDAPTADVMRLFYQALQRGEPADVALTTAKRAVAGVPALSHPHFWASFVLTGPADPVRAAPRWRDVAGVALLAAGLATAAAALWQRRRRA